MNEWDAYGLETVAVRAGQHRTNEGENSEPIFPTSSFTFKSAAQAAARFGGEEDGNIYSRFTNPTVRTFEERLAAMEGGERCVATSSGMSAILATCMGLLQSGDHVVSSRSIFGTTTMLFQNILFKFGITTTFVELNDYAAWESSIIASTKLLFLETPSNPLAELADIKRIAKLAKSKNVVLAVDNCLTTPVLQKPLALGADIVIHSATKYLDGQGRAVGGAVVGKHDLLEPIYGFLRTAGPTMSPFNAWIFLKGLETLQIRMERHCQNAMKIAQWLSQHPVVTKVYYPGLENHPDHLLAKSQQKDFGGIVAFEVKGGRKAAWNIIDNTRLVSITANLGDTKTTITHPATTTHGRLSADEKEKSGISEGMIRLSIGLEDPQDIIQDLKHGLG
jgi:O-succinylhomoserine sulfhydrylase